MGGSANAFTEGRGVGVLHSKIDIFFNFVSEGGYVCEVDNAVVFCIGDGEGECAICFFHGHDWDHDVICPCLHFHVVRMVSFVHGMALHKATVASI